MIPEFRNGVRTDLIIHEINQLMNKTRGFGIGKVELYSIERFRPQERFHGKILTYKIKEFNRAGGSS